MSPDSSRGQQQDLEEPRGGGVSQDAILDSNGGLWSPALGFVCVGVAVDLVPRTCAEPGSHCLVPICLPWQAPHLVPVTFMGS